MRCSYIVPMRWMVIYEYEVPGGVLNLSSTKLPWPWSPWVSSPSRKNPHDRTGNWTWDLMISSQKLWPLDHETGRRIQKLRPLFAFFSSQLTCLTCCNIVCALNVSDWINWKLNITWAWFEGSTHKVQKFNCKLLRNTKHALILATFIK
jgi:hypothetical protein